jgi:hypothetical protein
LLEEVKTLQNEDRITPFSIENACEINCTEDATKNKQVIITIKENVETGGAKKFRANVTIDNVKFTLPGTTDGSTKDFTLHRETASVLMNAGGQKVEIITGGARVVGINFAKK